MNYLLLTFQRDSRQDARGKKYIVLFVHFLSDHSFFFVTVETTRMMRKVTEKPIDVNDVEKKKKSQLCETS